MLNALLDGWFKFNVGDGAVYALLGFVIVFLGIVLLVLIFTALGKVMTSLPKRKAKKSAEEPQISAPNESTAEGEIPPEVVAVITAAVAAMLEGEKSKCEFVVRRIKRL